MVTGRRRGVRARRRRRQLRSLVVLVMLVAGAVTALRIESSSAGTVRTADASRGTPRKRKGARATAEAATTAGTSTTSTTSAPTTTTIAPTTTVPQGTGGVLSSAAVTSYLDGRSGDITAALYDLGTGTMSQWRPGTVEYTASIVKVDILATLLHQSQQTATPVPASEQALATSMIEESDDDAASDLWDDIGQQSALAAFNALLPLHDTTPGTDGHWGGTETTAADQVSLLRAIVQPSKILDPASQSYELGLMENIDPSQAWGVTSGVPSGVTIALKNGWLPLEDDGDWQINSIGWIDGQGRDYILAVMTKNNDTEAYGIDTIEGLSQLVWQGLGT